MQRTCTHFQKKMRAYLFVQNTKSILIESDLLLIDQKGGSSYSIICRFDHFDRTTHRLDNDI